MTTTTENTAPRKLTISAKVETEKTGKRMCPVISKITIILDDKVLAVRSKPLGGEYNESQALLDFKKNRKEYKLTFEGNKHRGLLKPFGF